MSVLFAGIDGTETPNVGYGGLLGGGGARSGSRLLRLLRPSVGFAVLCFSGSPSY